MLLENVRLALDAKIKTLKHDSWERRSVDTGASMR